MSVSILPAPHNVHTTLNYYKPLDSDAPYLYLQPPPDGTPATNVGSESYPVVVYDIRGKEDTVSLDKTGFQFVKHESKEKDFLDEEAITTVYYKEVEEILKKEAGAKRVFIFDHIIRRNYAEASGETKQGAPMRGPVEYVHIDQSFEASVARVHRHVGDDAERLLKSRVRIINVWRPIGHPVAHKPLAVADYFSLDAEHDLVPVTQIYPDRVGGTFGVRHNPQHKWHFLADQTPDEVTLIKCFDSDTDKARLTPHSAFVDDSSPASAPQRQSIEVRTLVFDSE